MLAHIVYPVTGTASELRPFCILPDFKTRPRCPTTPMPTFEIGKQAVQKFFFDGHLGSSEGGGLVYPGMAIYTN